MIIEIHHNFEKISKDSWTKSFKIKNPFCSYEFLQALETEQCLFENTGWYPYYLVAKKEKNSKEILAFMPLYLKTNSYGEYIFDWSWANAYAQYGRDYYPKLTCAIPFSPVSSPKILGDQGLLPHFLNFIQSEVTKKSLSSAHLLFVDENILNHNFSSSWIHRHSMQYHFFNDHYENFDSFLNQLRKSKRKNIRKERDSLRDKNLNIERLTGDQLSESDGEVFYQFYLKTIDKKNAHPYLTKNFFKKIFKTMKQSILLVRAQRENQSIAQSLFFYDDQKLYGRYWGSNLEIAGLHFELCYYQGIEFTLERSLRYFEAGAQGEHKIPRGFLPTHTHSLHLIKEKEFDRAIQDFCDQEKRELERVFEHLEVLNPFKRV